MPGEDSGDPFRTVGLVVVALAVTLVGVVLAVQVGRIDAVGVLTTPLVVAVPVLAAALYWYLRRG